MSQDDRAVSYFARTTYRNTLKAFGIRQKDRLSHMYVIGKTGVGKSTLLENLILQDIQANRGLVLLDPHGELCESVYSKMPAGQRDKIIYFDVADQKSDLGFNPLAAVPKPLRGLAAGSLLEAFKKVWSDSWGPRLEHVLRNALFALLELPQADMRGILQLMSESSYRNTAMQYVSNPHVRNFWLNEFAGYPARMRAEVISPVQNKVGAMLTDPLLQKILTGSRKTLRFRNIMDNSQVLLVNLSKGRIGEDTAALLGSLIVSRINLAAMSRADTPEPKRRPFICYLDEFHTFTTLAFASMLSELRKYGVGMVLAHQYLDQLEFPIKAAILGNAATMVVFRIGMHDAELFAKEFHPHFSITDLANLPNHHIALKLMIDGTPSKPFSAETLKAH